MSGHRRSPLPPEPDLVAALRAGDEATFALLLDAWSPGLLRTARGFVADAHTAEDVVQETWLAVLRGLDRFEGRSALRTWTYQILINVAKTRGQRDARVIPESSLPRSGPTVPADRFRGPDEPYPGHWRNPPAPWPSPEASAVDAETRRQVEAALDRLPSRQRTVITLRDVEGHTAEEVCQLLDLSPENQPVLLHRARAFVRAALADYLAPATVGEPPMNPDELNCDELVELVTAYLEDGLDPCTRRQFDEHLDTCKGCQRYLDQIRRTIAELGRLPADGLSGEVREGLLGAFRG